MAFSQIASRQVVSSTLLVTLESVDYETIVPFLVQNLGHCDLDGVESRIKLIRMQIGPTYGRDWVHFIFLMTKLAELEVSHQISPHLYFCQVNTKCLYQ